MENFDVIDCLDSILETYKGKVSADIVREMKSGYGALLDAEAECRRAKSSVLIRNMAKLKIEKKLFLHFYDRLSEKTGPVPVIEDFLDRIDASIREMSFEKNHMRS